MHQKSNPGPNIAPLIKDKSKFLATVSNHWWK